MPTPRKIVQFHLSEYPNRSDPGSTTVWTLLDSDGVLWGVDRGGLRRININLPDRPDDAKEPA